MGILTFPTAYFAPQSLVARLSGASIAGGQSISGLTQYATTTAGGIWEFEFGAAVLWDVDKYKTWLAIAAASDNGAMPFVVPLSDRLHQPLLDSKLSPGTGFSDESTFSDGTLWDGGTITASITGSAPLRATNLTIAISGNVPLVGGEHFTIWHPVRGQRMYRVMRVLSQGDGAANIDIRPPLRQATIDGQVLDFDKPRCTMIVRGDMSATLDMLRRGSAKISFIETFQPIPD